MNIIFTTHAQERMTERAIGAASVLAVLHNGEHKGYDAKGNAHLHMNGYTVVATASPTGTMRVLTVYANDTAPVFRRHKIKRVKRTPLADRRPQEDRCTRRYGWRE